MSVRMLVRILSWAGVMFIASLAFWVSYHAIRGVWITSGAGRPQDAWAIPLLIDGFIIVGSLVALARALDGVRGGWVGAHPWVLVLAATMVSLLANVAHAKRMPGPMLFAALIPLILCTATELVIGEFRRTRKHTRTAPAHVVEDGDGTGLELGRATRTQTTGAPGPSGPAPGAGSDVLGVVVRAGADAHNGSVAAHRRPLGPVGLGARDAGREAGPGREAVPGAGSDGSAPSVRPDRVTVGVAVMRTLDERGVCAHEVTRTDIIEDVCRHMGQAVVNVNTVGNELTTARQTCTRHPSTNGGVKV